MAEEFLHLLIKYNHSMGIMEGNPSDGTKVTKKAKIRNQYHQVPHLTQDTTWEMVKNTRKHYIQESQEVSPFLAGDKSHQNFFEVQLVFLLKIMYFHNIGDMVILY